MTYISPILSLLLSHAGKGDAYLDPGSGSFIIQLIIASLVGAGFIIRGYWSKITTFFRGDSAESDDEQDDGLDDV